MICSGTYKALKAGEEPPQTCEQCEAIVRADQICEVADKWLCPDCAVSSGSALRCECDDVNVICPHCGASYQPEGEDFSEDVRDETCPTCKQTYQVWQEFRVTHYTAARPRCLWRAG